MNTVVITHTAIGPVNKQIVKRRDFNFKLSKSEVKFLELNALDQAQETEVHAGRSPSLSVTTTEEESTEDGQDIWLVKIVIRPL